MHPASEPKTNADRLIDDAFITPRVLDESALNAWAESIRALIQDADTRSNKLSTTAADTLKLCTTIRDAAKQLQSRIEAGSSLAASLDTSARRAESVIDRLSSAIADDKDLEALATRIVEQRRAAITARVNKHLDALATPIEQAESRAAEAEARARRAEQQAEQAEQRAAETEARLIALESRLDELTQAAEQAADTAAREHERIQAATTTSVSRVQAAAAVALDTAERDTEAVRHNAAKAITECESAADTATSRALEAIEQLRLLATDIDDTLAEKATQLLATAEPLQRLAARTEALLGDAAATGSLDHKTARAEQTAERLEAALPGVEAQLSRIDAARDTLAQHLDNASSALVALDTQRAELTANIEQDIDALATDLSPIEHAAAALRRRIEEFERRVGLVSTATDDPEAPAARQLAEQHQRNLDQLRANADEITASAQQRLEEAGMWIISLINKAEQLAGPDTQPSSEPEADQESA